MSDWGTVKLGTLSLREALTPASEKDATADARTLDIKGQEACPDLTAVEVVARHDDILGLADDFVPVTFTDKPDRNGFYQVISSSSDLINYQSEVLTADWTISLTRVGFEAEIDVEHRLSGAQTRQTPLGTVGDRWDAPPIGHYGYYAGSTVPTVLSRTTEDGTIKVYRGLALGANPRYACSPTNYLLGMVRVHDSTFRRRTGTRWATSPTAWSMTNGMCRVQPRTNGLTISAWTGGAYQAIDWDITALGGLVGAPTGMSVLRNDPECSIIRVLFTPGSLGRITADLTLRRGSRFVEVYLTSSTSTTLKIARNSAQTGANGTGFVSGTANDTAGNRYVIGSALAYTSDLTLGGLSVAATLTLDAFVGVAAGGSSAVTGDAAADLSAQYLGAVSNRVQGVRR